MISKIISFLFFTTDFCAWSAKCKLGKNVYLINWLVAKTVHLHLNSWQKDNNNITYYNSEVQHCGRAFQVEEGYAKHLSVESMQTIIQGWLPF